MCQSRIEGETEVRCAGRMFVVLDGCCAAACGPGLWAGVVDREHWVWRLSGNFLHQYSVVWFDVVWCSVV